MNFSGKKKGRGFTLIEVMAVIIIFAIISIILLPIVSNIIEKSRKSTFVNSIYSAMRAIDENSSNNDFKDFPTNGVLAKTDIPTLEKNPFTDGKFRLKGEKIESFKVTDGRYCATGTKNDLEVVLGPCYLLDKTAPIANLVAGIITSNSIQVVMNAIDEESDIVSYQFSIDNGNTWTNKQIGNNYTFTKLKNGTSFNIKARVVNENNLITEKSITLKTLDIPVPTYTSNPSLTAWSKNKVVTINYPTRQSNFIYEYSINNGVSWLTVPTGTTQDVIFNDNGNLTARVRDGYNTVTASTLTITTIDTLSPTIVSFVSTGVTNTTISVKATATGSNMGIKGYQYSKDDGATWSALTTSNTYTYTGLSRNTTYPLKVRVTAGNDKIADSNVLNVKTLNEFNIIFNANGGSVSPASKVVVGGNSYGTLPTPSRDNYNFTGWYTSTSGGTQVTASSIVNIASDQTLYAQWSLKQYTVSFNANGGSVYPESMIVTYSLAYGTLPTPSRSNYTFLGWYTSTSGGTQVTSNSTVYLTSNQTLYAQWKLNSVTVNFDANGGSGSTSRNVVIGSTIGSFPETSRSYYDHQGWFTAPGGGYQVSEGTVINSGQTFYSRWYHGLISNSMTNNYNYKMTVSMVQTGINSVTLSATMSNANRSSCGNGTVSFSCTGGKSGTQNLAYSFGVAGSCAYTYSGSWSVSLPSYTITDISTGSGITCTYNFYSNNVGYFGSDTSASTSFTMGT